MESSVSPQPSSLAEVAPLARQLPAADKLRLIRILAEELDTGENIAPFELAKTYYIATPCTSPGTAQILADAMRASADNDDN